MLQNYPILQIQNEHEGMGNIIFMQDIYRPVKELLTAVLLD